MKKTNSYLFIPLAIFTILYIPFLGNIPYLDGNIDFIQSYDFFTGGFSKFFLNWGSVHPPFNFLLTNIAYILGVNTVTYSTLGLIEGLTAIVAIYYLCKTFTTKHVAIISALLLSTSPFFISIGIFALRDFLIISLLLLSFYFYQKQKYFFYALTASAAVLTKETMMLIPLSIIFEETISFRRRKYSFRKQKLIKTIGLFTPIIIFLLWLQFLNANHQQPWHDWLFTPTANKGTMYTIIYNLYTGNLFNKYAYQQWLQLFILNFNWVYWLISLIGAMIYIQTKLGEKNKRINSLLDFWKSIIKPHNQIKKTLVAILIFCITYILCVLTIQTYTIPRYTLPMIPFMFISTSLAITTIIRKFPKVKYLFMISLGLITILSSFFSLDPISIKLWGKTTVLGETLYDMPQSLAGNDGITYNTQYLIITKKRTNLLNNPTIIQGQDCYWLFPDPNNDIQTIHILKLTKTNNCLLPNLKN